MDGCSSDCVEDGFMAATSVGVFLTVNLPLLMGWDRSWFRRPAPTTSAARSVRDAPACRSIEKTGTGQDGTVIGAQSAVSGRREVRPMRSCSHVRRFAERELVALSLRDRSARSRADSDLPIRPEQQWARYRAQASCRGATGLPRAIRIDKPGLERIRWCARLRR